MEIFESPPLQKIIAFLTAEGLPTQDLADGLTGRFFAIGDQVSPHGIIGLETHGQYGLLRSLVVSSASQSKGAGTALVKHVEALACDLQLQEIYLLTETAESFFAKSGYEICARGDVAEPIKNSAEFSSLCPDSATVMKKTLATR